MAQNMLLAVENQFSRTGGSPCLSRDRQFAKAPAVTCPRLMSMCLVDFQCLSAGGAYSHLLLKDLIVIPEKA